MLRRCSLGFANSDLSGWVMGLPTIVLIKTLPLRASIIGDTEADWALSMNEHASRPG